MQYPSWYQTGDADMRMQDAVAETQPRVNGDLAADAPSWARGVWRFGVFGGMGAWGQASKLWGRSGGRPLRVSLCHMM